MEKSITPVTIWTNGVNKNANLFSMISISDNLIDTATFYYQLLASNIENSNQTKLTEGNLTLDDNEYSSWDGSNDWIMSWAAEKLNITII